MACLLGLTLPVKDFRREITLGDLRANCYTQGCIKYTCGMPIRVDTAGKTVHGGIYFRGSAGEMVRPEMY